MRDRRDRGRDDGAVGPSPALDQGPRGCPRVARALVGQRDRDGQAHPHDDGNTAHGQHDVDALLDREVDLALTHVHAQPGSPERDAEGQRLPGLRQSRVEGDLAAVVAHAAEAVDERAPDTAGGCHVNAVRRVVVQIGEVDEQARGEVFERQLVVADLGRDDRLHDVGQRRVTRGDRVVVVEVGTFLLRRELVTLQQEGEHDIRLLEHLEAVDHEGVVVQQQRAVGGRRLREVPTFLLQELRVLRVDAQGLVKGDVHCFRGERPLDDLGLAESEAGDHEVVGGDVDLAQSAHTGDRVPQVRAGHDVRVEVVVDDSRVLVGPGDAVDVEDVVAVAAPEAEVGPHARRLHQDVDGLAGEEVLIAGGRHVLGQRIGDVSVDVILRGAGGVVRGRLQAVDRAPREQRAQLVQFGGAHPGVLEHRVPEPQRVARGVR